MLWDKKCDKMNIDGVYCDTIVIVFDWIFNFLSRYGVEIGYEEERVTICSGEIMSVWRA